MPSKPEDGEDYDDFMTRCQEEGGSDSECQTSWENYSQAQGGAPVLKYRRVLQAFYSSPWAILPAKLAEIRHVLHLAADGKLSAADLKARMGPNRPTDLPAGGTHVSVVRIDGVLCQHSDYWGVSCEQVASALDHCLADRQCDAVVLAFDSPGGSVAGIPELASKIYKARGQKKLVAVADSMCASAAYWLASQCDTVHVTPGGMVGSIGVLAAHDDLSGLLEQAGVKTTLVTAGKYKAEGNPYAPLDAEAQAEMQRRVDAYYGLFTAAVARGRGATEAAVRSGYGEGRVLTARRAVSAGLADQVTDLRAVLASLGAPAAGGPSAQDLRRKLDLALEE